MKKNFSYFMNEYNKIEKNYNKEIENLTNKFSIQDISKMVIEEYNNDKKISYTLKQYIEDNCSKILDFFDNYDFEEIYSYIQNNYKIKNITIEEKEEISQNEIIELLEEKYFGYDSIKYENGKFYGIEKEYKTIIE